MENTKCKEITGEKFNQQMVYQSYQTGQNRCNYIQI